MTTTGQLYYQKNKEKIKKLKSEWQKRNPDKVKLYQWRYREKKRLENPDYGKREEVPIDPAYFDSLPCGHYLPDSTGWQSVCTRESFIPIKEWSIDQ